MGRWEITKEDLIGLTLAGTAAALTYFYLKRRQAAKPFLVDSTQKYPVRLVSRENLGRNVIRLRFELPENHYLGLETGQHVQISAQIDEKSVTRNYTPTSLRRICGYFEIVLKVYNATTEDPKRGTMSRYLNEIPIGSLIQVRGPVGQNVYHGRGNWTVRKKTQKLSVQGIKEIGLVAGGSGITPMLQTIHHIINDLEDLTHVCLVFANSTDEDLFLQEYLDELHKLSNSRLKIWYTLSISTDPKWNYSVGRVDYPMLSTHLPNPSPNSLILVCGPRGFETNALQILKRIGHEEHKVIAL
ncbi:unnamed protein product, partial [Mesorhabditis belari]|uniref:NADH-cytochrome b5 reductase n=1 Tax=Mesorhabditis belari TaxID=2138241 RepID=A0AAF3F2A6_9BILA